MPTNHNYAACAIEICVQCDSFSDGWTAGKSAAFQEIAAMPSSGHSPQCGCRPCAVVRAVVRQMLGVDTAGVAGLNPRWAQLLRRQQP